MTKPLKGADMFCGAGGTSTGLIEAARREGRDLELTAINHWQTAVNTHAANHLKARHLCADLDSLNPRSLFLPDTLDLLWASPECTHHSCARGGKPINEQSRATAWCVTRWAEALRPKAILVENVKEFETWGPIGTNGKPLASRKGELFRAWVKTLEASGYRVEWRVLCAADYGDPTTRRRLFVYAVRGRRPIVWPEPTHAPIADVEGLFSTLKPWRTAREIISWDVKGRSVFKRKKPLAEKTMRRIMLGLEKYGLKPFIVPQHRGGRPVHSVEEPVSTLTTDGAHALARPYLIHLRGTGTADSIEEPLRTVAAGGQHVGVATPYLVQVAHGNGADPNGDSRRSRPVTDPLPTVAGNRGDWAVCEPFVMAIDHNGREGGQVSPVSAPVSTITSKQRHAVVEPYLIKFYGTGVPASINDPLDAVTTNDRFGLCQPIIEIEGERYMIDILFRMLTPKELSRAQGFPEDYQFTGNATEVVKQIGNAVPTNLAAALAQSAIRCL